MAKRKLSDLEKLNLRKIRDIQRETLSDKQDVDSEIAKGNKKAIELINSIEPWAELYSLSFVQLVSVFFHLVGWSERLRAAVESEDIELARQAIFDDLTDEEKNKQVIESLESRDEKSKSEVIRVLLAMFWNSEAIRRYHEPMNVLVEKAQNDQDALMKAVAVDRSAVANSKIAKVIAQAQLRDDAPFMALLAKSVTRTKPIRKPALDEARLMIEVTNDLVGLDSITQNHLTELLVNELEVYPENITDPESSVKKLIQYRKKEVGKSERD